MGLTSTTRPSPGTKKRSPSSRGKYSRNKGKRFEREVATKFRTIYRYDSVKRGWQTAGGNLDSDVVTPHFWIECKVGKQPNIRRALTQAQRDALRARSDKLPIAVTKIDHQKALVTLELDSFLEILSTDNAWWEN